MSEISIRFAVPADLEQLVDLETRAMHFPMGHRVREWFRNDFPEEYVERIAVAVNGDRIVSAAALLPKTIFYRGVELEAGYWEAVVTEEEYRRRGLCRRLFEYLETQFVADVVFVQGLTWLYRRFGYYPALGNYGGLDSPARAAHLSEVPATALEYRTANPADAQFLISLHLTAKDRYVVSSFTEEGLLRYFLRPDRTVVGPGGTDLNRWYEWRMLLRDGVEVGAFLHDPWDCANLSYLEIVPGKTTWREAGAAAIHETATFAKADRVKLSLPPSHPLFQAFPRSFQTREPGSGPWAAKIADPVLFLNRIAPALEAQLANSALSNWTGEITLSRISDGLKFGFLDGTFTGAESYHPERADQAKVRLMPGRFEALVLGYRSIEAILEEDQDCATEEESLAVLSSLFPAGESLLL